MLKNNSSTKSSAKSNKSQHETKRPDRYELHRRLQDLTYWERHNRNEFYIRWADLRRDMGYRQADLQNIFDTHKGLFGVRNA